MSALICQQRSSYTQVVFFTFIFLNLCCISAARAGLDPYTITRTTGNTYTDISGGTAVTSWMIADTTTIVLPWPFPPLITITINSDDNLSKNLLPIGFTFYYDGSPHTQFRVSSNGFLTFNTATNANGSRQPACGSGDAYSGDNATFSTPGTKGTISAIAPFYDDLVAEAYDLDESVHYQTSGSAPNRVLTVQWRGMSLDVNSDCTSPCSYGSYNFQIKLYEATGDIEFVYGTMTTGADEVDDPEYTCGLNSASLTASPTTAQLLSQQTANSTTFTNTHTILSPTPPATNSKITFTRTAPAPATGVPTCIYYNFPANGATNQCRNAIISWSACDGVPNTFDVYFGTTNPPSLATGGSNRVGNFFNPGALAANTTYYWRIVPENTAFGSAVAANMPVYSFTTGGGDVVTGISSSIGTVTGPDAVTLCTGQTTTLTVNGSLSEGSVYNWTSPSTCPFDLGCKSTPAYPSILCIPTGNCAASSRNITFLSAGTNKFYVFARGCNGTSSCGTITITVIDAATAPTSIMNSSPGGNFLCFGTGTTLTAQGGTGSKYEWFTGSCGGTPVSGTTNSIGVVMPSGSVTYYVRRIDECTNVPTTCASITLTELKDTIGYNLIFFDVGPTTICPGETPANINGSFPTGVSPGGTYSFLWESSTTSDSTGFATASGTYNTQGYIPGTLSVTTWYRRIVIAKNNVGLDCSDANVSNVLQIVAGSDQCDDGNSCTNDICQNAVCSHECTLALDTLVYHANSVEGCADGDITAIVNPGGCPAWDANLYYANVVHRSWSYLQGDTIFWDGLPARSYVMVVSGGSGCNVSRNIPIAAGPECSIGADTVASTPTSVGGCNNASINAVVNAFVCDSEWTATLFDSLDNVVDSWTYTQGSAILWENLESGDYKIILRDNAGSCATQELITVPSGPPCRVKVQNVQKTVAGCDNNTITADVSSLTCSGQWFAYLYVSDYSSFIATWSDSLGSAITWNDIPLGTYHIFATDIAGCSDTADVILSCTDNDPCTADSCDGGCSHSYKCEDNNPCTEDYCQGNGQCANNALICNDGNLCTNDACVNGNCVFTPVNCADNNACTVDNCFSGNCAHTPLVCNDNNSCTQDYCQGGNCIFQAICQFNDNNPCTDDYCVNRACLHVQKNCNDNYTCTNDFCQAGVCVNDSTCDLDDGDACTTDQCLNGSCVHTDTCGTGTCTGNPGICADTDPCTTDTCILGECAHFPKNCDDGSSCTTDACNNGTCTHAPTCVLNDNNPCTRDTCGNGSCLHLPISCNDGNACTDDTCASLGCEHDPLCILDDGDPCTNDFCLSGQCIHNDIFCNDGLLCTTDECVAGQCVYTPVECDDGDLCTTDSCRNGSCIFPVIPGCDNPCDTANCTDGNPCTVDSCNNGICAYPALDCDDGNPCTTDTCNGGCVNTPLPNCNVNISGAVVSELGDAVPTVTFTLTGTPGQNYVTAQDGLYNFTVGNGSSFTITPSKSNDSITNNGVSTFDIIVIQRHILAIQPLGSSYKKIAADVNFSETISTLDIVLMRTVILAKSPAFPNNKLWAFVRSDFNFTEPSPFPFDDFRAYANIASGQINQNFIGMKLGDVNNSWNPLIPKRGAVADVRFSMDEYAAMRGDEIIVPVKVKDFNNVAGYQFTLTWDAGVLQLAGVNNRSLEGFYGEHAANEGTLTTLWYDEWTRGVTLADDHAVFEMKFRVTGDEGSLTEIKIGSELAVSEAYNENLDLLNILPQNGMVKVTGTQSFVNRQSSLVTLSAQPNPFSNTTSLIFTLPEDEAVSIVIYDLLGKEVKHIRGNFEAGEHAIGWTGDDNAGKSLSHGLYHVRMVTGDDAIGLKVLLVK